MSTLILYSRQEMIRYALVAILAPQYPDQRLAHFGGSPDELYARVKAVSPALVIVDIDDLANPCDTISHLAGGGVPTVAIGASSNRAVVRSVATAGAASYVPKTLPPRELITGIDRALAGDAWLPRQLVAVLASDEPSSKQVRLSEQQTKVLVLYASGLKIDAIARRLSLSPHTVKQYLDRVREKYSDAGRPARTKSELYRVALEDHLIA